MILWIIFNFLWILKLAPNFSLRHYIRSKINMKGILFFLIIIFLSETPSLSINILLNIINLLLLLGWHDFKHEIIHLWLHLTSSTHIKWRLFSFNWTLWSWLRMLSLKDFVFSWSSVLTFQSLWSLITEIWYLNFTYWLSCIIKIFWVIKECCF